tara:strand:+ start:850 stop:1743 length:894 start_codon:yes stop_codon:yes gene_type:complete
MPKFSKDVTLENGQTITIYVKRPDNDSIKDADIHRAKIWNKAFKEGVLTKKEVEEAMKERGIWDQDKADKEVALSNEILQLERKLFIGDGKKKPKVSEGRKLAIEMREKRFELRQLIEERIQMDENTAESLADNARFDFLVSCCTFHDESHERVFEDYEDYNEKASQPVAIAAAQLLANMMYDIEADYEEKLPENRFLKQFDLINEEGYLCDPNNPDILIDQEGKRVNELGHYINEDGERVDNSGNLIDDDGMYVLTDYENDLKKKEPVKKTRARRKTTATKKKTVAKKTATAENEE